MPKLYDEEGNEVTDVLTKEEVEAKLKEKTGLTEAEREELEKLRKKDLNFAKLRSKVEGKKKEEDKKEDEDEDEEEDADEEDEDEQDNRNTGKKDDSTDLSDIARFAPDLDEDQRKKALFYWRKLSEGVNDPRAKEIFLKDAVRLVSGEDSSGADAFNRARNGSGSRTYSENRNKKQESDASRTIASSVFRLEEGDKRKFGGKDWSPQWKPKPKAEGK